MNQCFRSTPAARPTAVKGELVFHESFDYASLNTGVVRQIQRAAQHIRHMMKRTLET
jgi:hypothetical protein